MGNNNRVPLKSARLDQLESGSILVQTMVIPCVHTSSAWAGDGGFHYKFEQRFLMSGTRKNKRFFGVRFQISFKINFTRSKSNQIGRVIIEYHENENHFKRFKQNRSRCKIISYCINAILNNKGEGEGHWYFLMHRSLLQNIVVSCWVQNRLKVNSIAL